MIDFRLLSFASGVAFKILGMAEQAKNPKSDGGTTVTDKEKAEMIAAAANEALADLGASFRLEVTELKARDYGVTGE